LPIHRRFQSGRQSCPQCRCAVQAYPAMPTLTASRWMLRISPTRLKATPAGLPR
jgi:hypothetical protein